MDAPVPVPGSGWGPEMVPVDEGRVDGALGLVVAKLRDKVADWGAREVVAKLGAAAAANEGSNLSASTSSALPRLDLDRW